MIKTKEISDTKPRSKNHYSMMDKIQNILPFFVFLSFYLGMLNIKMVTPIVIMGGIVFLFNILKKNQMKRTAITKVEALYFLFIVAAFILSIFSFNKTESIKQIIKICTLIFIFWQFIVLFRNTDKKLLKESFSIASLSFFAITFVLYVVGLIALGFNFNVENIDIWGVTIDRHMPRLISLAYNDPNITALYLSVPFAFFLADDKAPKRKLGLIASSFIIGLTLSRGAYLSLVPSILAFVFFSKWTIKKRLASVATVVASIGLAFCLLLGMTSIRPDQSVPASNIGQGASSQTTNKETKSNGDSAAKDQKSIAQNNNKASTNNYNNSIAEHFDLSKGGGSGRLPLWNRAIETIKKHPLTGVGLNNTYVYTEKAYGKGKYIHNTYLEIFMEEGVIGGSLYLLVVAAICISCWRLRKQCLFPALLFIFLFCAQVFLSVGFSEVFFAGILVLVIYSRDFSFSYAKENKNGKTK